MPRPLLIYAPSSFSDVMPALVDAFQESESNPKSNLSERGERPSGSGGEGQAPIVQLAATSKLAAQIAAGAPGDVVLTADLVWMEWLAANALLDAAGAHPFASNTLVVVVPSASTLPDLDIQTTLASCERLALAADPVPAGRYARQALAKLGILDEVGPRIVSGENVRTVLAWVSRGEVSAGIVYATDAIAARGRVRVVHRFASDQHDAIVYPVARLRQARHPDAVRFVDFLLQPSAKAILAKAGFGP